MEDFIVSARKYRPQTFDSVVGQETITNTLIKAIENNHLAQAFLFCGPRGVGKTTCARILAKRVNAFHQEPGMPDDDFSFNIFELDAASNSGVDDIRNLIDQVRIPPQTGKYKVYIIDEVHMLSANAFNAFLKTLEEPPAYAIFILATTEKHKVLPTILSRCQIFDFNRIQIRDMVSHLAEIAKKESIEVADDALHTIAEKADGALRDALSIFDQIVGFAGDKVSYQDVIANLNILDYDYYFDMVDAFLEGDKSEVLVTFNKILEKGFDGHNFINGLSSHFRNLLFCTSARTAEIIEVGQEVRQRYLEQAKKCETSLLMNALHILSETDLNYKSSKNQRLLVEIALLKLCTLSDRIAEKKKPEPRPEVDHAPASAKEAPEKIADAPEANTSEPIVKTQPESSKPSGVSELEPIYQAKEEAPKDAAKEEPLAETKVKPKTDSTPPKPEMADKVEPELKESEKFASDEASIPENSKNDEPPTALPAPKLGFSSRLGKSRSKSMPSLAELGAGQTESKPESGSTNEDGAIAESYSDKPATDFNLAQLWEAWDSYTEQIKEQDKQSYYATLTKHKPIMREPHKVELLLDNLVQLSDLDADKVNLLEFLRERLNNWQIQLEGVIDEEDKDDGDSLYDPQKKFEAMAKANPVLAKMRSRFDLDVDYD